MKTAAGPIIMPAPKIKRVLNFRIDPSHLKIDACILVCIEPRLWNKIGGNSVSAMQAFADAKGWKFVPLTIAGGVKTLVSDNPDDLAQKEAQLWRINQELDLHKPGIIALSVHRDCGAYGYPKDPEKESETLYTDLWKAKVLVEERFGSRARLELYVFDADGVEEISF